MTVYSVLYAHKSLIIIYTLYYISRQVRIDQCAQGALFHLNPVFHKLGQ